MNSGQVISGEIGSGPFGYTTIRSRLAWRSGSSRLLRPVG
jgi:hypothetical protein